MAKKKATDRMAKARAAITRKPGPSSTGEQLRRVGMAYQMIAFHPPGEVVRAVMEQFGCCKQTADKAVREARELMIEEAAKDRTYQFAHVLGQLEHVISKADWQTKLGAIKAKIDLLGLAAARESHVAIDVLSYDPAAVRALEDPEVRETVLQLEETISDLDKEETDAQTPED